MQKSETITELAKAMSAVQLELKPAVKDANNPFFKSKYADLNSVWDSCRELLGKYGLAVIQGNSVGLDNTVIVETVLTHSSGQWIQSELALPLAKSDPQGVGSAITYGRRYGLAAMIGIVADEDDDGNGASGQPKVAPPKTPPSNQELLATDRAAIKALCQQLNKGGDTTKWTAGALNHLFEGGVTIDNANAAQLAKVKQTLTDRANQLLQENQ